MEGFSPSRKEPERNFHNRRHPDTEGVGPFVVRVQRSTVGLRSVVGPVKSGTETRAVTKDRPCHAGLGGRITLVGLLE